MPKVKKSVTVNAPVDLVYRAWHNFENFPQFMDGIEEVRCVSGGRSHWKAKGPLGKSAEWDAEITVDKPNETIGWRSIDKSEVRTAGRVNFRGGNGSTDLEVVIEYEPPAGAVGSAVAKIFSDPERQVEEDLQNFKEVIEQGAEASGLSFDNPMAGDESLGGSMGAVSEQDLESIAGRQSGVAPQDVDDPATRP
jgi:uncharacterized membrane protein